MVKKVFFILLSFIVLFSVSGCRLKTEGNTLYGFTQRLNSLTEYELTTEGYIKNESEKSLTKFFKLSESEIMLQLNYNEKNELSCLHIVFDNLKKNDTEELNFIEACIYAFIDNTETAQSLLKSIDFENCIYEKDINTKKEKIGNIDISIDVTDIGTVISVEKNIL